MLLYKNNHQNKINNLLNTSGDKKKNKKKTVKENIFTHTAEKIARIDRQKYMYASSTYACIYCRLGVCVHGGDGNNVLLKCGGFGLIMPQFIHKINTRPVSKTSTSLSKCASMHA